MLSERLSSVAVTVTVPVYNTSQYLRESLDALAGQTLRSMEVILVDDGSTDNSGQICDEYAEKYPNFRVIHQKNGGLAAARRTGLTAARGEYVIVCDSDDWTEPEMYERLYAEASTSGADIVVCGYFADYPDGKSVPLQVWFNENGGFVDNDDFLRRGAGSSWLKLIKRSLFERSGASYEPGINMGEDALIIYKLMKGNPKIRQIRGNLYHYRRLPSGGSYTNNVKMTHIAQMDFIYRWLKDNYSEQQYESIRYSRALDIAFACLRTNDTDRKYLNGFLRTELKWNRLFANKKSMKAIMIMLEKALPLKLSKSIVKAFYPLVYR